MFRELKQNLFLSSFPSPSPSHSLPPSTGLSSPQAWVLRASTVVTFFNKREKNKSLYSAQVQLSPEIPGCCFADFQRTRGQIWEGLVTPNPLDCWSGNQRFPQASGQVTPLSFPTNPQNLFPDPSASSKAVTIVLGRWADTFGVPGSETLLHGLLILARPLGPNPEQASSDLEALTLGHHQAGIQAGSWRQPTGTLRAHRLCLHSLALVCVATCWQCENQSVTHIHWHCSQIRKPEVSSCRHFTW